MIDSLRTSSPVVPICGWCKRPLDTHDPLEHEAERRQATWGNNKKAPAISFVLSTTTFRASVRIDKKPIIYGLNLLVSTVNQFPLTRAVRKLLS